MNSPLPQVTVSACNSSPGTVPVFNCVVILRQSPDGRRIEGRVANLGGLRAEAPGEREVLMKLSASFKDLLRASLQSGQTVSWIDPPEQPADGEQLRYIPVHL